MLQKLFFFEFSRFFQFFFFKDCSIDYKLQPTNKNVETKFTNI